MGYYTGSEMHGKHYVAVALIAICFLAHAVELGARPIPVSGRQSYFSQKFLVTETTVLTYHNGTLLVGATGLNVYLLWYGNFTDTQKSTILDFFSATQATNCTPPSVDGWWKMTGGYKDMAGNTVMPMAVVQGQLHDDTCSKGKSLVAADIETLVTGSLTTFPVDTSAVYLVLTADDVVVEDFCKSQCASHSATAASAATQNKQLPYGFVGNPGTQCPGLCSWPFAQLETGPYSTPLLPPNGDIGVDGMIINIASVLAGTATNPFNDGYYQGDASAPLEAASACAGMFGQGAYSGYAGQLLSDSATNVSFNAWGINTRKYLLPALWDPTSTTCTPPT